MKLLTVQLFIRNRTVIVEGTIGIKEGEEGRRKMNVEIMAYKKNDLAEMIKIWNEVVKEGTASPQEELLTMQTGKHFFASQTYSAVAVNTETETICGIYILHSNNIGHCSHICNASYAVSLKSRGQHIGEKLVSDSLIQGQRHNFKVLQFNAVVATNIHARHLYEHLGFAQLGTIPKGFQMKNGQYEDICPYYHEL